MKQRKILPVILSLSLIFSLTACSEKNGTRDNKPMYNSVNGDTCSGVIAENDKLSLEFETGGNGLILRSKTSNMLWSTSVSDEGFDEEFKNQQIVSSALVLDYMTQMQTNYDTAFSSDTSMCELSAEKTDNGVKVTYSFEEIKISIPVIYTLRENGFSATVDLNSIAEGSAYMVGRITLLPMTARTENNGNGHLLIPSGSGGITNVSNPATRTFKESVYGEDLSEQDVRLWTTEKILMPVFGAYTDNFGIFGIIESGAENAYLYATANDDKLKYSASYPIFKVRGYDKVSKGVSEKAMESYIYDEDIADNVITVGYYPLQGDNADYSGMASVYRNFLESKYGISEKDAAPLVSLKFLGGVDEKKFALGIPYKSLFKLTDVDEAKKIADEISETTGSNPLVQLVGFGKGGLENGKIAGGYKIASKLGSFSDIADWQKEYSAVGSAVALDFDIINFSKSGNGFSVYSDKAKTAANEKREQYYYQVALLDANKSLGSYYLLSRSKINKAADKLLKLTGDKKLNAVSLSTLSNTAYSDYGNRKNFAKSGMAEQAENIFSSFKESNIKLMSNAGFEYAAGISDYICDVPINSSRANIIDVDIPFYQMVFGARTPIYNISVNLSQDDETALLKAAESGTGLSYTVCRHYSTGLIGSSQNMLYAADYSGVKDRIAKQAKEYSSLYNKVRDSFIIKHTAYDNGIKKTEFANGTTVYVNYTEKELSADGITVSAKSYKVREGH